MELIPYNRIDEVPQLIREWNRDFSKRSERRRNIRRTMRLNSRSAPKGKGGQAWKRVAALFRPDSVSYVWPLG